MAIRLWPQDYERKDHIKSLRVTLNADMLWESPDLSEQRQALRSKIFGTM